MLLVKRLRLSDTSLSGYFSPFWETFPFKCGDSWTFWLDPMSGILLNNFKDRSFLSKAIHTKEAANATYKNQLYRNTAPAFSKVPRLTNHSRRTMFFSPATSKRSQLNESGRRFKDDYVFVVMLNKINRERTFTRNNFGFYSEILKVILQSTATKPSYLEMIRGNAINFILFSAGWISFSTASARKLNRKHYFQRFLKK